MVMDRMAILQARYDELVALAGERKHRLEQNKRLCQYWWDVAELEQNFKELEQVGRLLFLLLFYLMFVLFVLF